LQKKFERYRTKKTDSNGLYLHTLQKMIKEKAIYEKYLRGTEEVEKIEVLIPLDQFEHEARDVSSHNINDFIKSSAFTKEYVIENRHIKATVRI
jgi:hypothetical protein